MASPQVPGIVWNRVTSASASRVHQARRRSRVRPSYKYVRPYLAGTRVLDLGCNVGDYLADFGKGAVGVDINRADLGVCRDRRLDTVAMDLNGPIAFRASTFDAVFCSHVLEHVDSPIGLLRECHRVLKDGALLVVGLPIERSLVRTLGDHYFRNHSGHLYSFSLDSLQVLFSKTGFVLERVILDPPLVDTLKAGFLLGLYRSLPAKLGMWLSTAYWAVARKV